MNKFIKVVIVLVLLILCTTLTYYFRFIIKTDIVYSHFFYVPIVCAGFWWGIYGIVVPIFLCAELFFMHYFSNTGISHFSSDILRGCMFIAVGTVIGLIREINIKVEKRFKEFSRKILFIREEEKKRTAIDLHDELGSMIVAVNSCLDILEDEIKNSNTTCALQHLAKARGALKKSVNDLKRLAVDLRPPDLDIIGLNETIKQHCDTVAAHSKINIELNIEIAENRLREDVSIILYRITQEALTNIVKHSRATTAKISLSNGSEGVNIDISDNGEGFNVGSVLENNQEIKIGIEGMRQRVESICGSFTIKSDKRKGCRIHIVIPQAYK